MPTNYKIIALISSLVFLGYGWHYSYSVFIDDNYTVPMITDEETIDPTAFGIGQGLLIATIATGFSILLLRYPRYLIASAGIIIITTLTYIPVWHSADRLGISDWDYTMTNHNAWRTMILEQRVWPWWNPYLCGGSAGWADPEFTAISPYFLLELALGTENGLRLGVIISATVLGLGMLLLARQLKLSPSASFLTALIMPLSSVFALRIAEGHTPLFFSIAYIPWVLWAWHKAYAEKPQTPKPKTQKMPSHLGIGIWGLFGHWNLGFGVLKQWTILCGVFLATMFYQGGIYILMYLALIFIFLILASKNKLHATKITAISCLIALGLSAIKLIPMLSWIRHFQDSAYASSAFTLPHLHQILIGRYLHGAQVFSEQGSGWHEYGAFIGITVLLLAILSVFHKHRRTVTILFTGIIAALILSTSGPYLKPLFDQAGWLPRSNISRLIIPSILGISLLAGFGIDSLKKVKKRYLIIIPFITIAIAEMATLSYPIAEQAFVLPRTIPIPSQAKTNHILYSNDTFEYRHRGNDYTRAWSTAQQGYGTMSYCSVAGPKPAVYTIQHEDRPFAFLDHESGSANVIKWSPNKIIIKSKNTEKDNLLLNLNYAPGWEASWQKESQWIPAKNINGLVSAAIPPGQSIVTLRYRPLGLLAGSIVTSITILILATYFGRSIKWRKLGQASSPKISSPSSR